MVDEMLIRLEKKHAYIQEREDEEVDRAYEAQCAAELGDPTELPRAEPKKKGVKFEPRIINTDLKHSKGFAGTALKLFPNVRDTRIEVGEECSWFKLFGINRRSKTLVTMYMGPNRRLNRYLSYQYTRLINSIGGTIKVRAISIPGSDEVVMEKYIKWSACLKDINHSTRSSHPIKKLWRLRVRRFWSIGMNLVVNSTAFRVVLITSVLGKVDR
jgi:hypothetical protein